MSERKKERSRKITKSRYKKKEEIKSQRNLKMVSGTPNYSETGKSYLERKEVGNKIRIWAKFSTHTGDEPLYIECFIEGYNKDYEYLKQMLLRKLDDVFNYQGEHDKLIDEIEFGTTKSNIEHFSAYEGYIHIAYKHSQNQRWQVLK